MDTNATARTAGVQVYEETMPGKGLIARETSTRRRGFRGLIKL